MSVPFKDEVLQLYNELKLSKAYRYLIFRITDDLKLVVCEKKAQTSATYEQFVADLPKDDCRYAVFDLTFTQESGDGDRSKLVFVLWTPDTAKTKLKMVYANTKKDLRQAFVGIGAEIQATDMSEIDYQVVLEKVSRGVK
eukprot:m51a1_g6781 putative actin-depolymerizing factor adf6 (140) ;mRNA; f:135997-136523